MDKFISANEYLKLKNEQQTITNEIMQNLSSNEQLELTLASISGDIDEYLKIMESILDKVANDERIKEIRNQFEDAIIEQDMSFEDFKKTLESTKSFEQTKSNSSTEELAIYNGVMDLMQRKVSFGEADIIKISKNFLIVEGLLNETNSNFESLKMYTKNSDIISISLTSLEPETRKKHEFTIVFEEDKIYHKTTNIDNSFSQEEEYISDKKKEFGISNENEMNL